MVSIQKPVRVLRFLKLIVLKDDSKEKLWPISDVWDFHCGRYEFANLSRFTEAITKRYGKANSLEDFDKKSQAMNYELMRPMFEAISSTIKKEQRV